MQLGLQGKHIQAHLIIHQASIVFVALNYHSTKYGNRINKIIHAKYCKSPILHTYFILELIDFAKYIKLHVLSKIGASFIYADMM